MDYYYKGEKFLSKYYETSSEDYLQLALSNYSKAIELQSDNTEAIYKRSIIYGHLEEYEDKLADLTSLIKIYNIKISNDKENPNLHFKIALAFKYNYNEKEYLEKAMHHFNQALKLGYNTSDIYFEIAEIYSDFQSRNSEIALIYYNKAIEISPNIPEYYLGRGDCYCLLKRLECALADFSKGIELNMNDWIFYNRRGELFLKLHEWSKATKDYVQLRKLHPNEFSPKIEILKNMAGGCTFELYFAEDLSKHKHWHPNSYFIEDCIFTVFHEAFVMAKQDFAYYGNNEYNNDEMKVILNELKIILNKFNDISDYQNFFEYMVKCKFIYTLVREFDDYDERWQDILSDLRKVTCQLINLISDTILKNQKLFLFGI